MMTKISYFSVFAIAAAASVWTTAALAGGGGGYALVCNSVSPTESCNIQQDITINVVFEQNITINEDNILNQAVLNQPSTPQIANPATSQLSSPQVEPQITGSPGQQQQYATPPIQSEIGYRSLQKEISNRSMQREIGYRSTEAYSQSSNKVSNQRYGSYEEPRRQSYQMETAFPVSEVKVKDVFETKIKGGPEVKVKDIVEIEPTYGERGRSRYDYSSSREHGRGGENVDVIFVDSIVTLLGRL